MTHTLDAAIAKLAALPPEAQDRAAGGCSTSSRTKSSGRSVLRLLKALAKLAAEARADRPAGQTTDVDPDNL